MPKSSVLVSGLQVRTRCMDDWTRGMEVQRKLREANV